MIDTKEKLAEFLPRLGEAGWVAIDTEADSLHAYPEKLCLLQISVPREDRLVDTLAGIELAPLLDVLRTREVILHGADYDLRLMFRSYGFVPTAVFDTMLAARLLGVLQFGLTDLAARFLGVALEKGSQKADWAKRPLTPRMVAYACNDTRHLKLLSDKLRAELTRLGRIAWHTQLCDQLIRDCTQPRVEDPDTVWRLKGADRLERRGMGVLRELWHWREREAVAANKPPFFVVSHDTLVAIAAAAGRGEKVDSMVPIRFSPRRRGGLLQAVERALALPETALPERRQNRGRPLSATARRRVEELRIRRDQRAKELTLDPSLIASRAMLCELAQHRGELDGCLLPWQRELLLG